MTRDEKADLYDNLVAQGDVVNRKISVIKTNLNLTKAEEVELISLNKTLQDLEARMNSLLSSN